MGDMAQVFLLAVAYVGGVASKSIELFEKLTKAAIKYKVLPTRPNGAVLPPWRWGRWRLLTIFTVLMLSGIFGRAPATAYYRDETTDDYLFRASVLNPAFDDPNLPDPAGEHEPLSEEIAIRVDKDDSAEAAARAVGDWLVGLLVANCYLSAALMDDADPAAPNPLLGVTVRYAPGVEEAPLTISPSAPLSCPEEVFYRPSLPLDGVWQPIDDGGAALQTLDADFDLRISSPHHRFLDIRQIVPTEVFEATHFLVPIEIPVVINAITGDTATTAIFRAELMFYLANEYDLWIFDTYSKYDESVRDLRDRLNEIDGGGAALANPVSGSVFDPIVECFDRNLVVIVSGKLAGE